MKRVLHTSPLALRVLLSAATLGVTLLPCSAQNQPGAPPPPPLPPEPVTPATHVLVPATRPPSVEDLNRRQWSGIVEPGEKIPPLTVSEKLVFAAHEEFRWRSLIPVVYSAGYGVLRDNDPKYGINKEGFGERAGAAALRQSIGRELSDSLLPIVFREDPRYYRQAYGTYGSRGTHALTRIFVTQTDSGKKTVNLSDILGRGMNAALTQTYYPQRSIGTKVVLDSWGISLSQLGGFNLVQEFWPDVKRKVFHAPR